MKQFELCQASEQLPVSKDFEWIFEIKFDGERVKVFKDKNKVCIWNRDRKTNELGFLKNNQYPEIVEELKQQEADFIIDGEICCADITKGLDFLNRRSLQQNPMKIKFLVKQIPVKLRVFDILEIFGNDVRKEPLWTRRSILNTFIDNTEHIEVVEYDFDGDTLFQLANEKKLEGVIAKRKLSPYVEDRNSNWLKIKRTREEVVKCKGYETHSGRSVFGSMITDKGNVSLLTKENKEYYFKNKPKRALVRHYGIYKSGKMRNPVFIRWI